jgi:cobyrinic acid a,c-diamide synthase
MKGVIVGGTRTSVGKTTITLALLKGLAIAGNNVQSFKVGPGFVDIMLHEQLTGRPCYNLDAFLMGEAGVKRELAKSEADLVVIEGASGLYTGASSTARIADVTGFPIILVVDANTSSESVAATVLGFVQYASCTSYVTKVVGVIATRVGSDKHTNDIRLALQKIGLPLLGVLRREELDLNRSPSTIPRHKKAVTDAVLAAVYDELVVDSIIESATELHAPVPAPLLDNQAGITIGIPFDSAFCFYYRSNLEALERAAELVYFSPLADRLPPVDALYVGGGYPEAHGQQLSENTGLLDDIRTNATNGMPIYAEGGGLAYLSRSLTGIDGVQHPLAGVIPAEVRMTDKLQAVGHSEAEVVQDCAIASKGERLLGHEYHHSIATVDDDARFACKMRRGVGIDGRDGIVEYGAIASFQHVHVCGMRAGFDTFVRRAQTYARA